MVFVSNSLGIVACVNSAMEEDIMFSKTQLPVSLLPPLN